MPGVRNTKYCKQCKGEVFDIPGAAFPTMSVEVNHPKTKDCLYPPGEGYAGSRFSQTLCQNYMNLRLK